ncbi:hypothetical protein [Glutamicibacter sp. AOP5-A2-18]|uniref:hypothetical protein n=1 Tax=Glutamicibacter sp. AOP5-A2-18 TaxID=3457656 RepID=UPI00403483DD
MLRFRLALSENELSFARFLYGATETGPASMPFGDERSVLHGEGGALLWFACFEAWPLTRRRTFDKSVHKPRRTEYDISMAERIMFIQLKTGYNTDRGPAWITRVRFSKSWSTAYFRDLALRKVSGTFDANFVDPETGDEYWISGPKRDRSDGRYSNVQPSVDADVADEYQAFLAGAPLPGRENG